MKKKFFSASKKTVEGLKTSYYKIWSEVNVIGLFKHIYPNTNMVIKCLMKVEVFVQRTDLHLQSTLYFMNLHSMKSSVLCTTYYTHFSFSNHSHVKIFRFYEFRFYENFDFMNRKFRKLWYFLFNFN